MFKKLLAGLFVLSFLLTSTPAQASFFGDILRELKSIRQELALLSPRLKASVADAVLDSTPRIAYWSGKVNQHTDSTGQWLTDPDGTSGANLDKLTYCKKWYPNTTSIADYQTETITTWRTAGNTGDPYTLAVMTTRCVQGTATATPSITVLSPNGGEVYTVGQQITVKWTSSNIASTSKVIIVLDSTSLNYDGYNMSGSNGTLNDGEENYILANYSGTYKIRILSMDNNNIVDSSNNYFTINSANDTSCLPSYPSLTLSLDSASPTSDMPLGSVNVELARFRLTASDKCNLSIHYMTIADLGNSQAISNIKLYDSNNTLIAIGVSTVSSNSFEFRPTRSIILSPGQTKVVVVRSDILNSYLNDRLQMHLVIGDWGQYQGGAIDINTNTPLTYQNIISVAQGYVRLLRKSVATDCNSTSVPSITVLSPNGGEAFVAGQQITVKWTSCNIPTNYIIKSSLTDMVNGLDYFVAFENHLTQTYETQNDGEEILILPSTNIISGQRYQLTLQLFAGPGLPDLGDSSNNLFTIIIPPTVSTGCTATSTPSITVLSPNGGETYIAGQQVTVKWTSCNVSADTKIALQLDSPLMPNSSFGLGGNVPYLENDGVEVVTLPTTQLGLGGWQYGLNYKIKVIAWNDTSLYITDSSDNLFTINALTTSTLLDKTPRIAYWWGKVNQYISVNGDWKTDSDGTSGASLDKLTYCKKWYPNTTSIADYKTETITGWRSAGNTGGPYTLAVMTTKCVGGMTTATPSITVLSPNGGEVYTDGQSMTIKWKTLNIPSTATLKISFYLQLSTDPTTYDYIITDTLNDGSETVNLSLVTFPTALGNPHPVNEIYGKNFRVNINWERPQQNTHDQSDNLFTINAPTPPCIPSPGITCRTYTPTQYSTSTSQDITPTTFTRTLKIGSRGEDVKDLQSYLGIKATGIYGRVTARAVRNWQLENDIKPDGRFGPQSFAIIYEELLELRAQKDSQ